MTSFQVLDNDWVLNSSGRLQEVSGPTRLIQNFKKLLQTSKENAVNAGTIIFRYNPNYGTNLEFVQVLNKLLSIEEAVPAIKQEIKDAVILYTSIQSEKLKLELDPSEVLVDSTVLVTPELEVIDGIERIVIRYEIEIVTQDGEVNLLDNSISV